MSLEELQEMLRDRAAAIAELVSAPPSSALLARLENEIERGEALRQAQRACKLLLILEASRRSQLEAGLKSGLGFAPVVHINYRA